MPSEKPDLIVSDLLTAHPYRKLVINVADMHPGRLTLMEALDMVDASGIDGDDFVSVLSRGTMRDKARLLYAMAWVIARRAEPDLTYDEVCTYQLEVIGKPFSDKKAKARAEALVAVGALAGVSTTEAGEMTVQEVAALNDLHRRRNVRRQTPRRRKRVG